MISEELHSQSFPSSYRFTASATTQSAFAAEHADCSKSGMLQINILDNKCAFAVANKIVIRGFFAELQNASFPGGRV